MNRTDREKLEQRLDDPTNPPVGTRLMLVGIAARLNVQVTELAKAGGISRTSMQRVLTNEWPASYDRKAIEHGVIELLRERGAHVDELATAFHAYQRRVLRAVRPAAQAAATPPDATPTTGAAAAPPPEDPPMLLPKQALSPAARRAFKLFTNPFDGEVLNDEAMFIGDDIAYCRESIWQCAHNSGFVAVVGESGAGKTTLLQDLEARLEVERSGNSVIVIRPGVLGMEGNDTKGKAIKSADILHAVITRLAVNEAVPQTLQARTTRAGKILASSAQVGNTHLLVVEEAHSMPDATLKHLKRMHEMRLGRKPLLGILLLAQPELKERLAEGLRTGVLREVAQRCEVVELLPLDGDLKAYLQRRAAAAGVQLEAIVDDQAIEQLRTRLTFRKYGQAISMCYPLAVNNLITRALNTAAELGAPKVTKDVVASC